MGPEAGGPGAPEATTGVVTIANSSTTEFQDTGLFRLRTGCWQHITSGEKEKHLEKEGTGLQLQFPCRAKIAVTAANSSLVYFSRGWFNTCSAASTSTSLPLRITAMRVAICATTGKLWEINM